MTFENQNLLDAVRLIVREEVVIGIAPLRAEVGELRAEVGELRAEVGELRAEVGELRAEVGELRTRVNDLTMRMVYVEEHLQTLDSRTSQMLGDLLELRDRVRLVEERIDLGFQALKSDLHYAFSDIRKGGTVQDRSNKVVEQLQHEVARLNQRLTLLESAQQGQ